MCSLEYKATRSGKNIHTNFKENQKTRPIQKKAKWRKINERKKAEKAKLSLIDGFY
jgi:hypothetical protein